MNETKFVLELGIIIGIGMLAWAGHGVVTGKIYTRGSSGRNDGESTRYHLLVRTQEPVMFWLTCATYAAVGIAVLIFDTLLLMR